MPQTHEITELLQAWSKGDSEALSKLVPLVDHELKKVAHAYLRQERPGHILQTTALMDEALIRLMETGQISWRHRKQFYSLVALRMHHVLVEYARRQLAAKRGNRPDQVDLDEAIGLPQEASEELLMLHEALAKLASFDPRKAGIVEQRYFGGLTLGEIAEYFDISKSTVEREWDLARAWLKNEIYGIEDLAGRDG
jgi:RNA polymerase sigma-70 factor (ECF subfamily)